MQWFPRRRRRRALERPGQADALFPSGYDRRNLKLRPARSNRSHEDRVMFGNKPVDAGAYGSTAYGPTHDVEGMAPLVADVRVAAFKREDTEQRANTCADCEPVPPAFRPLARDFLHIAGGEVENVPAAGQSGFETQGGIRQSGKTSLERFPA